VPASTPTRPGTPAPYGVRLDSYAHIRDTPGLVAPGRPADSRLVTVLLDPAVQMPPSVPPLPDDEIRVIASWVATTSGRRLTRAAHRLHGFSTRAEDHTGGRRRRHAMRTRMAAPAVAMGGVRR
jgi:hypothetical protein